MGCRTGTCAHRSLPHVARTGHFAPRSDRAHIPSSRAEQMHVLEEMQQIPLKVSGVDAYPLRRDAAAWPPAVQHAGPAGMTAQAAVRDHAKGQAAVQAAGREFNLYHGCMPLRGCMPLHWGGCRARCIRVRRLCLPLSASASLSHALESTTGTRRTTNSCAALCCAAPCCAAADPCAGGPGGHPGGAGGLGPRRVAGPAAFHAALAVRSERGRIAEPRLPVSPPHTHTHTHTHRSTPQLASQPRCLLPGEASPNCADAPPLLPSWQPLPDDGPAPHVCVAAASARVGHGHTQGHHHRRGSRGEPVSAAYGLACPAGAGAGLGRGRARTSPLRNAWAPNPTSSDPHPPLQPLQPEPKHATPCHKLAPRAFCQYFWGTACLGC